MGNDGQGQGATGTGLGAGWKAKAALSVIHRMPAIGSSAMPVSGPMPRAGGNGKGPGGGTGGAYALCGTAAITMPSVYQASSVIAPASGAIGGRTGACG